MAAPLKRIDTIATNIQAHEAAFRNSFDPTRVSILQDMAAEILEAFKGDRKILLCGNGGSAADAQHIAAEFIGRFKRERKSLPAVALTTDTSALTALANDYSYEEVFARQVEGLGCPGDILIAISTSGKSKNVLKAARKAKALGLKVFGFTGASGGDLKDIADRNFCAGSDETPHIQEMHITALHAVSEAVEDALFSE